MNKMSIKNRDSMRAYLQNRGEKVPEEYDVTDEERNEESKKILLESLKESKRNHLKNNPNSKIYFDDIEL